MDSSPVTKHAYKVREKSFCGKFFRKMKSHTPKGLHENHFSAYRKTQWQIQTYNDLKNEISVNLFLILFSQRFAKYKYFNDAFVKQFFLQKIKLVSQGR